MQWKIVKMPIYEYECPHGHVTEKLANHYASRDTAVMCSRCGKLAKYKVSAPHIDYLHMGVDPTGNPTAGDKWARMHIEAAKNKSDDNS